MDEVYSQATQPAPLSPEEERNTQFEEQKKKAWGQVKGLGQQGILVLTEEEKEYSIGRHSSCSLVIQQHPQISNKHCSILKVPLLHGKETEKENEKEKGKENEHDNTNQQNTLARINAVLLKDYSSNGTYVNGELVGKGNSVSLKHRDMISFATKHVRAAHPDLCFFFFSK